MFRRSLGSGALFAVMYSTMASAVYFSLGAVAEHALGLTPVVFAVAVVFFLVTTMTYMEGASLHQDRGGSTVFARYAFNELWSFVAGWVILLDYAILIALCALTATNYGAVFWGQLGSGTPELIAAIGTIVLVAAVNVRGLGVERVRRLTILVAVDVALQVLVIVVGLFLVFDWGTLVDPIQLGTSPTWSEVIFALTVTSVAFIGLESASGLAGEVRIGRGGLRRLVASATTAVMLIYIGIALVAVTALPVVGGETRLGREFLDDPVIGIVQSYGVSGLGAGLTDALLYAVAAGAALLLIAGANSGMLGLSRLAYSLATNRQIPSVLGRLHPTRSTPYVLIVVAAILSIGLVAPLDLDFLVGIYAFGAMLAFTIAHLSVCVLRYREPDRDRPYRVPFSVRVGGGALPLPAVIGAIVSGAGWVSVIVLHEGARLVGSLWLALGLAMYLSYRLTQGKSVFRRVTIPARALRAERPDAEYGSILVPLMGGPLDDDIVQTAGRLASDEREDEGQSGAVIEALWIFEVPMSLPIDAALPDAQLEAASQALLRAKAVGEEYAGVEVATAKVRARRAGQAIVDEARRRGVEAIVLGAEEASRVRGGGLLGGRGGPLDNYVGDVTKQVVTKAPCRVILTAPKAEDDEPDDPEHDGTPPAGEIGDGTRPAR